MFRVVKDVDLEPAAIVKYEINVFEVWLSAHATQLCQLSLTHQ